MAVSTGPIFGLLGTQSPTPGGRIATTTTSGKQQSVGSGPKHTPGMTSAQVAAAVVPEQPPPAIKRPGLGTPGQPPHPNVPTKKPFSANNPMMGVQPPPRPHPGVAPPYPDARSPQPQMMPNGQVVMPMPREYPGLLHVPRTIAQGMTGLLHQGVS